MYNLDASLKIPLYVQLYEAIKQDIINNMATGSKLASIRAVANEYKISKNSVEVAYGQLYAEGYIESRPKSGYYVAEFDFLPIANSAILDNTDKTNINYKYDFFPARLTKESFPIKIWKRLLHKAVDDSCDFGAYPNGQGEYGLRKEIAKYLSESRGVKCGVSNVIVCGAFVDTLGIVASILQKYGSSVAIEYPGYRVARAVFENYNYDIKSINIDNDGLIIDELTSSGAKSVYITPSHQYPTGVFMPITNRLKLLSWASKNNGFIIEDDYDSELTYRSRPIPSLQGLDIDDRVIYIGTFSKALSPALRIGYMVLPNRLMEAYKAFHIRFGRVSVFTQKTLELFLNEGHFDRHIRKIRNINRKKHDIMKSELVRRLGASMQIIAYGGGLSIIIKPTSSMDLQMLQIECKKVGLKIYVMQKSTQEGLDAVRMGFGGLHEDKISDAIKLFADVWFRVAT